jgi:hypothetical protein
VTTSPLPPDESPDGSSDESPATSPGDDLRPSDPVLVRRQRIASLTSIGQRVGYALYALAAVGFFAGFFVTDYPAWLSTGIVACLIIGSVVLAPSIVFAFAVKAAYRADRDDDW